MPNVLSPRDLVSRPDNMDETVPHTHTPIWTLKVTVLKTFFSKIPIVKNNGAKRFYLLEYVRKFTVQSPKEHVCFYFHNPNKL